MCSEAASLRNVIEVSRRNREQLVITRGRWQGIRLLKDPTLETQTN
jgi:hypothetical protein